MKLKKYIILFLVGSIVVPVIAMKRKGDELVAFHPKRQAIEYIDLFRPIKNCDFKEFQQCVNQGADINQVYKKQPIFFHILHEIDTLRRENLTSMRLRTAYSEQREYSILKNNDAIKELYECLNLVIDHEKFYVNCINRKGEYAIEALIWRNLDEIYSNEAERILESTDDSFLIQKLLKKKAYLGPYNDGKNLLHYVAIDSWHTERNLKAAEMIVQQGLNVNYTTSEGDTALHLSCNNIKMVLLLLALGAQPDTINQEGITPIQLSSNPSVISMLTDMKKIKKYKEYVRGHIIKNICTDLNVSNILQFVSERATKVKTFSDSFPYTKALITYMTDMGKEIQEIEEETEDYTFSYSVISSEDEHTIDSESSENEEFL